MKGIKKSHVQKPLNRKRERKEEKKGKSARESRRGPERRGGKEKRVRHLQRGSPGKGQEAEK